MILAGIPNLEIHTEINCFATVSAVESSKGIASGHLVNLSIIVKQKRKPFEGGRGPIKSMLIC